MNLDVEMLSAGTDTDVYEPTRPVEFQLRAPMYGPRRVDYDNRNGPPATHNLFVISNR
jgi:hypothetical protein